MIGTYTAQLTANNIAIKNTEKFRGFRDPKVRKAEKNIVVI